MLNELWIFTGLVIAIGAFSAYSKSKDALHPAVVIAGPFAYFFCIWPILLNREGALSDYYDEATIQYCGILFVVCIAALYLGLNHRAHLASSPGALRSMDKMAAFLPPKSQQRIYLAAIILGLLALVAYASLFDFNLGTFLYSYSRHKGGVAAESGYVGEAVNLSLPAIFLIAVTARARGRLTAQDIALALLFSLPQLLTGTLGGRRGPIFIILATLFFSWFVATRRTPRLLPIMVGVAAIGFVMIAVQENRRDVYLGSGESFEITRALDAIAPSTVEPGNEYMTAMTVVVTSRFHQDYYWGYRYFVTLFVRPIPRQLWPDKYEDMNATWLQDFGVGNSDTNSRIYEATGYSLPGGVSTGSISDGYMEFSWGVVIMFYALGRFYAYVWRRHRTEGGFWTIMLFLMLGLCVYLPSQSFSAWLVRLIYGTLASYLLLRLTGVSEILRRSPASPPPAQVGARS